jgi:hypothetical protein
VCRTSSEKHAPALVERRRCGEGLETYARGLADSPPADEETALAEERAALCDVVTPSAAAASVYLAQLDGRPRHLTPPIVQGRFYRAPPHTHAR